MKQETHRWKPHWEHERVDESRCRASVSRGRMGLSQCSKKPRKGTEWCGSHTVDVAGEDADLLWGIDTSTTPPTLMSVKITKETVKQITLADRLSPFDYKERIRKTSKGPEYGFRSRLEAAQAFVEKHKKRLDYAKRALTNAEHDLKVAEKLLESEEK